MSSTQPPSSITNQPKRQEKKKRDGKKKNSKTEANKASKQPHPNAAAASTTASPPSKPAVIKKRSAAWKQKRAIRQKQAKRVKSLANALGTKLVFEDEGRVAKDVKMKEAPSRRRRRPQKKAAPKLRDTEFNTAVPSTADTAATLTFAPPSFVYNSQGGCATGDPFMHQAGNPFTQIS